MDETQNQPSTEPEQRQASWRRRGIYLLPNAFTTAALFCGFYAIIMAMNDNFHHACIAIFCAMVMDSMDGRVARMTNTQSEFGAQYDSLSDMVSFGVAPALVVYEWALKYTDKIGWMVTFIYCACAALRLARFNTNIGVVNKRYFQGLPSPSAAATAVGFVFMMNDMNLLGVNYAWLTLIITLFAGLSMVTNVPFYSFKDFNFKKAVPLIAIFLIALVLIVIATDPPKVIFAGFLIYGLSGYVVYAWRLIKGVPVTIVQTKADPADKVENK